MFETVVMALLIVWGLVAVNSIGEFVVQAFERGSTRNLGFNIFCAVFWPIVLLGIIYFIYAEKCRKDFYEARRVNRTEKKTS